MRSSSASAESAIPPRPYAAGGPTGSAPDDPAHLDRRGPDVALAAMLVTPAEDDQACTRGGADRDRRDRAHPVTRIAHRGELPALQLVDRELGQRPQRRLKALREVLGRLDRCEGPADDLLEVVSR